MAVAGIGVDIVSIERMSKILERTPSFAKRVFSKEEQRYCSRRPRPSEHYAARFAAREAVLKALGIGFYGVGLNDVVVEVEADGSPVARLSGHALEIAQKKGVREVALSISHTHDVAIANALCVTDDVTPKKKEEELDESALLAASFKEAKSVIDELERVELQDLNKE